LWHNFAKIIERQGVIKARYVGNGGSDVWGRVDNEGVLQSCATTRFLLSLRNFKKKRMKSNHSNSKLNSRSNSKAVAAAANKVIEAANPNGQIAMEGLTFDDVLLIPARSSVLPREVNISSKFTRDITLQVPIVSAAMDTVTDSNLAISIAQEGGIGVIHKNMSKEKQAESVRKVKRAENGMIFDPITIHESALVGDARKLMSENHIGGIPVVDSNMKLIGIVTNRDLRFVENSRTPISKVMTKDHLITTTRTDLEEATRLLQKYRIEKLPVVNRQGTLVGLITYKDITKIKDNPNASKDSKGRLLAAAAVGVTSDTMQRVEMLVAAGVDAICIDTAHGHSTHVLDTIKVVRKAFPHLQIVAGNIATGEAAKALAECGVDAVKVGIGAGFYLYDPRYCRSRSSAADCYHVGF
jgi:IMP dehydrogenase